MSDLIDTTEMYLKVVFELEEQGQPALRARVEGAEGARQVRRAAQESAFSRVSAQ